MKTIYVRPGPPEPSFATFEAAVAPSSGLERRAEDSARALAEVAGVVASFAYGVDALRLFFEVGALSFVLDNGVVSCRGESTGADEGHVSTSRLHGPVLIKYQNLDAIVYDPATLLRSLCGFELTDIDAGRSVLNLRFKRDEAERLVIVSKSVVVEDESWILLLVEDDDLF